MMIEARRIRNCIVKFGFPRLQIRPDRCNCSMVCFPSMRGGSDFKTIVTAASRWVWIFIYAWLSSTGISEISVSFLFYHKTHDIQLLLGNTSIAGKHSVSTSNDIAR